MIKRILFLAIILVMPNTTLTNEREISLIDFPSLPTKGQPGWDGPLQKGGNQIPKVKRSRSRSESPTNSETLDTAQKSTIAAPSNATVPAASAATTNQEPLLDLPISITPAKAACPTPAEFAGAANTDLIPARSEAPSSAVAPTSTPNHVLSLAGISPATALVQAPIAIAPTAPSAASSSAAPSVSLALVLSPAIASAPVVNPQVIIDEYSWMHQLTAATRWFQRGVSMAEAINQLCDPSVAALLTSVKAQLAEGKVPKYAFLKTIQKRQEIEDDLIILMLSGNTFDQSQENQDKITQALGTWKEELANTIEVATVKYRESRTAFLKRKATEIKIVSDPSSVPVIPIPTPVCSAPEVAVSGKSVKELIRITRTNLEQGVPLITLLKHITTLRHQAENELAGLMIKESFDTTQATYEQVLKISSEYSFTDDTDMANEFSPIFKQVVGLYNLKCKQTLEATQLELDRINKTLTPSASKAPALQPL